jgi:Zn-finger nucleic acid-binding protein
MPLLICPNDGTGMQEVNRNGVLIDICPQCRGVWLDRGELEKLLTMLEERADETRYQQTDRHEPRYDDRDAHKKPYRKKRGLFEFFDFD